MTPPRGVEDAAPTFFAANLPPTVGEKFIPPAPLPSSLTSPSHHLPKSHRKGAHRHAIHQHYPPLDTRQPADHGAGARAGGGTVPVLQLQRPLRRCRARGGKSFFHRRGPPAGHGHGGGHRTTAESRANVLRRVVEQFDEKDKFELCCWTHRALSWRPAAAP